MTDQNTSNQDKPKPVSMFAPTPRKTSKSNLHWRDRSDISDSDREIYRIIDIYKGND